MLLPLAFVRSYDSTSSALSSRHSVLAADAKASALEHPEKLNEHSKEEFMHSSRKLKTLNESEASWSRRAEAQSLNSPPHLFVLGARPAGLEIGAARVIARIM
ncbi:hypothetical protein DPX16_1771 [Anabarilius grahami]|uniref:Uncharacterized protein n=1 Tax=Anabarilius grahami TaxID=495550 RepID=A0A3N0YA59_ANAGA|nr:hypothetical protein DPX16_1771 [Anabarilius grahami]